MDASRVDRFRMVEGSPPVGGGSPPVKGGDTDHGGAAGALYNMALAGTGVKTNLRGYSQAGKVPIFGPRLLGLVCDKLRLEFVTTVGLEAFPGRFFGAFRHKRSPGRRRGSASSERVQVWTESQGAEGGLYGELRVVSGLSSHNGIIEFNPAKLDVVGWRGLRVTLLALGVDPAKSWFTRVDGAFDYALPRASVLLDDRKRKGDAFGVGSMGPETFRTGYRKGSTLKQQLYDKTAERRAAGHDVRAGVTRFEVQALGEIPVLGLGGMVYPGDAAVRYSPFHPGRIASVEHGVLLGVALGQSVRVAVQFGRRVLRMRYARVVEALDQLLPLVDPAPDAAWAELWAAEAASVLDRMGWGTTEYGFLEWEGGVYEAL